MQVSGSLFKQTVQSMRAVIAPKLNAVEHLNTPCTGLPLSSSVLFSSVSSIAGFNGHTNYCAANATLDIHAKHSALCGLPTTAVQWGAWSAVGMTSSFVVDMTSYPL